MTPTTQPGFPVRAFNSMYTSLWPDKPVAEFDPKLLEDRARRVAGCNDFGPDDYREGLEVLCRSCEEDAQLTAFGQVVMQIQIHNALVTRLKLIEEKSRSPEIFEAPLPSPLIIVGLPRSGTTFMHRLLSLAPNSKALSIWEVRRPMAEGVGDFRRLMAALQVSVFKMAAPGIDAKHRIDLDDPEECMWLLDSSLCSPTFWVFAPVYQYYEWLLEQDFRRSYRSYREHLQLFAAAEPASRLVLKAPTHTAYLEELIEAVPEAKVVQMHRSPVRTTSSVNSLFASFHGAACREVDVERMAQVNLGWLTMMAESSIEARTKLGEDRILDISYEALIADPIEVVRRIHAHYDLPFEASYEERLVAYLAQRPQHHFGKHTYCAEEFGMTDEGIATAFAPYIERFVEPATRDAR